MKVKKKQKTKTKKKKQPLITISNNSQTNKLILILSCLKYLMAPKISCNMILGANINLNHSAIQNTQAVTGDSNSSECNNLNR